MINCLGVRGDRAQLVEGERCLREEPHGRGGGDGRGGHLPFGV